MVSEVHSVCSQAERPVLAFVEKACDPRLAPETVIEMDKAWPPLPFAMLLRVLRSIENQSAFVTLPTRTAAVRNRVDVSAVRRVLRHRKDECDCHSVASHDVAPKRAPIDVSSNAKSPPKMDTLTDRVPARFWLGENMSRVMSSYDRPSVRLVTNTPNVTLTAIVLLTPLPVEQTSEDEEIHSVPSALVAPALAIIVNEVAAKSDPC
eukprot:586515-Rhodomonas_salina.1